jgi:hypothetical protein
VAFPSLPTLPDLPARVDPDGWLSTLDQQMYLRHVGHDGCVDVDLQTYSISSPMAKRTVLLQVDAAGKRCVVWHEDQMITTLPSKGLLGEEMARDDFLKHMHQEALSKAEAFSGEHSLEPTSAPSLVIRGTSPLKRANQNLPLLCDCTNGEGPLCLDPRQAQPMVLPNQVSHHEALRFAYSLVSLLPSLARKTSTVSMSLPRLGSR